MRYIVFLLVGLAVFAISCNSGSRNEPAQGKWIKGSKEDKIQIIESQFRGFDKAMIETDYRYQEIYWAGQNENWEYASYQLEAMETALKRGFERRPVRENSAKKFMDSLLPRMQTAIDAKQKGGFSNQFQILTNGCNSCHVLEKVPFIKIATPAGKASSVQR